MKTMGRAEKPGAKPSDNRLAYWAAALSCVSVLEHTFNIQEHLHEWWGYGTFFILATSFQLYYGVVLFLRPWRYDDTGAFIPGREARGKPYYFYGIVLDVVIILFYIFSRTTGMPFLSPQAVADPVTPLNLLSVVVNIPIIWCLTLLYRGAAAQPAASNQEIGIGISEPPPDG
jgi:hypothetical protein